MNASVRGTVFADVIGQAQAVDLLQASLGQNNAWRRPICSVVPTGWVAAERPYGFWKPSLGAVCKGIPASGADWRRATTRTCCWWNPPTAARAAC